MGSHVEAKLICSSLLGIDGEIFSARSTISDENVWTEYPTGKKRGVCVAYYEVFLVLFWFYETFLVRRAEFLEGYAMMLGWIFINNPFHYFKGFSTREKTASSSGRCVHGLKIDSAGNQQQCCIIIDLETAEVGQLGLLNYAVLIWIRNWITLTRIHICWFRSISGMKFSEILSMRRTNNIWCPIRSVKKIS